MQVDFKLQSIFSQIKRELSELGIEVTDEIIESVSDSQFKAVKLGMEQCDKIVLPFFGTFDIKKRSKFVYEQHKALGIDSNLTSKIDGALRKVTFKKK